MEGSLGVQLKQERALRVVEMAAISGFVEDHRNLQGSCLALCNLCRECAPWRCLRVARGLPSTLLAVFWPDLICVEAEGASRVLPPRRVLKVDWTREDYRGMKSKPVVCEPVEGQVEEVKRNENTEGQEEEEENVKRSYLTPGNIDLNKVRWPEGVTEINLCSFNRAVEHVMWPDGLEVLSFHKRSPTASDCGPDCCFNQPLDGVTFPAGLRELFLGSDFNQRIDRVAWPEGLELLSMPGFNKPIQDVQWPSGLKTLEFSMPNQFEYRQSLDGILWEMQQEGFNQPLGASLPASLETLLLSDNFNQSLRDVAWPSGLAVLGLGIGVSKESIEGVEWPPSLRKLVSSSEAYDAVQAPAGCRAVATHPFFGDPIGYGDFDFDMYADLIGDRDVDGPDDYQYGLDYDSAGSDFSL